MELLDSAIFIQGLVWTTILLSGPAHHEKRLAGFFIGLISIFAMLAYLTGYNLQAEQDVLDFLMLFLFLLVHFILLFFFHHVTLQRNGIWLWLMGGLLVVISVFVLVVRSQLQATGGDREHLLLKGTILMIPFSVLLYSVINFIGFQLQLSEATGRWANRKSITLLSLLAGLFTTWILMVLSLLTWGPEGNGLQSTYWKISLAVTLFVFGYLEVSFRVYSGRREYRPGQEVDLASVSALKKLMEEEKMYTDCELTLEKMADRLRIQPSELTRKLNHDLGTSFYALVNSYRVKEVQRKLEAEDQRYYTLLAIAFECGFNSKSTFNRVFKEFTGVTPSNYRQSAVHPTPR